MAVKVPVRTVYDNSNNAIGLSEFQSGEAVGYLHGGTGLTTIGTANQILKVNGDGNALEWAADAQSNLNPYLEVANAAAIYATKSYAAANTYVNAQIGASNTSIRQYINSEIGSSNTSIRQYVNAQIGSSNTNIRTYTDQTYVTKSVALTSNNALLNLINDRMQVANVSSLVSTEVSNLVDSAPEALNTLNELAAALGDDANFAATTTTLLGTKAANTYVNQTFATKSTALASNNAQNILINDRIQVANARVEFIQSSNTTVTNDATSITVQQSAASLDDRVLINPAGFITINIGGTDYKLPFFS